MIYPKDAKNVLEVLGNNLIGVSHDSKNFVRLPDRYWGYFARGHDSNGRFGVIVTYSEDGGDVDDLIGMYEEWIRKNAPKNSTDSMTTNKHHDVDTHDNNSKSSSL